MTSGLWFQNQIEPEPVSVLSPIGENHTQNRTGRESHMTLTCPDTGIELVTVWSGTLDRQGLCPSLSGWRPSVGDGDV